MRSIVREQIRNLLLFALGVLALGMVFAAFKRDFAHWPRHVLSLLFLIGLSIAGLATPFVFGFMLLAVTIVLNRLTSGRIPLLARREEAFRSKLRRYRETDAKCRSLREWYVRTYRLRRGRMSVAPVSNTDTPDWWEGRLGGRFFAIYDPHEYHLTIFLGEAIQNLPFAIKRIDPARPPKDELRLERHLGQDVARLAERFVLTSAPKDMSFLALLRDSALQDAILRLSPASYLVAFSRQGLEIHIAKRDMTTESLSAEVALALEMIREAGRVMGHN